MSQPSLGSKWQHYRGCTYEIVLIAMDVNTSETIVIYTPIDSHTVNWARPLSEWEELISCVGGDFPRFKPLD